MTRIGIPVPPGFIISSESYFDYLKDGANIYEKLEDSYSSILMEWENETGRRFSPSRSELPELEKFPILLSLRPSCGLADLNR
jgi:phosphoenolpyruvate synthase/pyruvate phosphate dikinase